MAADIQDAPPEIESIDSADGVDGMKSGKSWYEDDSFWETIAPILFDEKRLMEAPEEVEAMISLLEIRPEARILDLCCGIARHTLEFTRRGYNMTGVDRTRGYLDMARKEADGEGLDIEFVESDIRRFCRPDSFDVVLNLFTSFGYFDDPEDDRRVVENAYRSLREGGAFLVDIMGKEILAQVFQERDWRQFGDCILLEERMISRNWSWMENRWIVLQGKQRQEFRVSHRIYSAVELCSLFSDCGFERIEAYGELTGAEYDQDARRLIVTGRK